MASDQTFRLQEITRIQKSLEDERDKRALLYKKYHRAVNVIDGIDTVLLTISIGLLSSSLAVPVVVGPTAAALVCGLLGAAGKLMLMRCRAKAKKHDEIRILTESKLSTISDLVSTALEDGEISDVEFRLILDEIKKYQAMRAEIRRRTSSLLNVKKELDLSGVPMNPPKR